MENNYSIKIARNTADQISGTRGNAGMLPTVGLAGTFSDNQTFEQSGAAARANIDLGWTVFDGLRMFAAYDRLKTLDEINNVSFRTTVEHTIRQVINHYYLIVSTEQQLRSIQQTLEVSQARHDYVLARYEIGSASKLDVLNARVDFNTDSSAYRRCLEQILSAKINLNQLLARPLDTDFQVVDDIPYAQDLDYADILNKALEQNTELNISRLQTIVAEASKKEIDALLMPTVSLNAGYDLFTHNASDRGFYYSVGLRMNLFDGLETQRRRRNVQLSLESAKLAEEASLLNLEAQLRLNFINYQTNRDMVSLETENIEAARENMDISLERYRLGNLSALELREAQRNYLNAINRYTNSLFLTKLSETILLQLAGELGG